MFVYAQQCERRSEFVTNYECPECVTQMKVAGAEIDHHCHSIYLHLQKEPERHLNLLDQLRGAQI